MTWNCGLSGHLDTQFVRDGKTVLHCTVCGSEAILEGKS